jgi:hypothetical protein
MSAHSLRLETGRYERKPNKENKLIKIVREERTCRYCNNNDVEDEMHFLLKCPLYSIERNIFMDFIYNDNNQVASLQTKDKFYWLLNNENINIIKKLLEFILKNFEKRSSLNQNT